MKKETVPTMLDTLEHQARKVTDEKEQKARLDAIAQCRTWLALPWTQMLAPVRTQREALQSEGLPLIEKHTQGTISEDERSHLDELVAAAVVYHQFERKIRPTVRRVSVAKQQQQHERSVHTQHE